MMALLMTGGVEAASMKVRKEEDGQDKLQQKDLQIQQLRYRLRVDKNTIQSLRNQMKTLRAKKTRDDMTIPMTGHEK